MALGELLAFDEYLKMTRVLPAPLVNRLSTFITTLPPTERERLRARARGKSTTGNRRRYRRSGVKWERLCR